VSTLPMAKGHSYNIGTKAEDDSPKLVHCHALFDWLTAFSADDACEERQRTGAVQNANALAMTPEFREVLWIAEGGFID
jgi:hypothetical protein